MILTIHRGAKEIGGSCIELQSDNSIILIDFGLPLVDENKEQVNSRKIITQTKEALLKKGFLHRIHGLYENEPPLINSILLSHPHQDHYGLLSYINPKIPVYMSKGCKELIEVSYYFRQTNYDLGNIKTVRAWKPFKKGNFTITPYLVDHSGFDALAYLIEAEGKRIFYSGDFRGHGRKKILFDNLLKHPPRNIDYLILEGSMIGRDRGKYNTESDIEKELINIFKDEEKLFFVACSSQNIDRLVSVYRACLKTKRTFVIDPYTAFVLDKLKIVSPKIPQHNNWNNIKIFFVPNSYTDRMAEDKSLYKFKASKISFEEIQDSRNKMAIKDAYLTRTIFGNKKALIDTELIYSLWEGYLDDVKPFWENHRVPIVQVHTSGHAYVEELQSFVKAVKPKHIIPNHTFYPEKYLELFGNNVMLLKDKQPVVL
jgi:ribonuclease J